MEKIRYTLSGLSCANCAQKIERRVKELAGVEAAELNFMSGELRLTPARGKKAAEIKKEVTELIKQIEPGVTLTEKTAQKTAPAHSIKPDAARIGISLALLIIGIVSEQCGAPFAYYIAFYVAGYLVTGLEVIITAVKNIAKGEIFDENFLMLVATLGAFAIQEFPEAVAVMIFYQTGEMFQELAVGRSRRSIASLMDIRPDHANLRQGNGFVSVAPEEVHIGDIIQIKPGERVPLDGVVKAGSTSLDTASLTGESAPLDVGAGDRVMSGSVNLNGVIEVEVEREFGESTVQRILELVENAESRKSRTESFITRFARIYTPVVVLMAAVIGVAVPLVFGLDFSEWLYRGLLFLVVSCPCALVLSVPLSYFSGVGRASSRGILVKGSSYFDTLAKVRTVVFDKTGTLTKGRFKVANVRATSGVAPDALVEAAAYAEHYSSHPIAEAVRAYYQGRIDPARLSGYDERAGRGISVRLDGGEVLVGNHALLAENGISSPEISETHLHVALGGRYAGSIILTDEIKETSAKTVGSLKKAGISKIVMLTGDSKAKAAQVAETLGISEYHAELLPQDKGAHVETLLSGMSRGDKLAFVGDGINDAPVLARADVGVAMGGLGADSAIEAADVVLMNDDPYKLVEAIGIAKKTRRIVLQNIIFALGIKLAVQVLGVLGLANMWEAVFADVGVALLAVLNSMRLLRKDKRVG